MPIDHYSALFSIRIQHQFYSDSRCYDFQLQPTETCTSLLNGHGLVVKKAGNGLNITMPCDSDGHPFIGISGSTIFHFLLKLQNSKMEAYTDLPALTDGCIYQFDNAGADTIGETELDQGEVALSSVERPDHSPVFGQIAIHVNDSIPTTSGTSSTFHITLSAREETWKYYLVVEDDTYDWSVTDADEAAVTFTETDLNLNDPTNDRIAMKLKEQYPDNQRYLFTSDTAIPYQGEGRKNLQLIKDAGTIIEHLPNPSFLDNGVKVIKVTGT